MFLYSNKKLEKFEMCVGAERGPWYEASDLIFKTERDVNNLLSRAIGRFPIDNIDFSDKDHLDFNHDFKKLYRQLENVEGSMNSQMASNILSECEQYIETVFVPELLKLEMIIILNAFNLKDKPIIDVFYKYRNEERIMRDAGEFCEIMGGAFMTMYYKVG